MNNVPKSRPNSYRLGLLLVVAVLLLAAVLQVYRDRGGEDRVPWISDFTTALGAAQSSNKPILAYFSAEGCLPCRDLKRYVFSRADIVQAIDRGFVPLKIDLITDLDRQDEALALRYDIPGVPTLIILDSDGGARASVSGYVEASTLLAWLERDGHRPPNAVGSFHDTEP